MFHVRVFLGVLGYVCLLGLCRANEELPPLVAAQGTIEKVDKDAVTLRTRASEGKPSRNLVLKLTTASRLTTLRMHQRTGAASFDQKELRPEDLKRQQEIAVIYVAASPENVLLSAVVQPAAERELSSSLPPEVPAKVASVLRYVDEHHAAPPGYEGGRTFLNLGRDGEQALPRKDAHGKAITYHEWDVNPRVPGKNRGPERLVTGSDGSAYYTANHYRTFTKIR